MLKEESFRFCFVSFVSESNVARETQKFVIRNVDVRKEAANKLNEEFNNLKVSAKFPNLKQTFLFELSN